jgi:hypothetical protein
VWRFWRCDGIEIAQGRAQLAMKLFEISNRGLAVIGVLVLVLWGVILAERAVIEQAREAHYEFLQSHPDTPTALRPQPTGHPTEVVPMLPADSISQVGASTPKQV